MVDYFLFISNTDVSLNRFYIYYASSRTIINDYALVLWTENILLPLLWFCKYKILREQKPCVAVASFPQVYHHYVCTPVL